MHSNMAEAKSITPAGRGLQRINYTTTATGERGSAVVRNNREWEETMYQYDRLASQFPYGNLGANASRYQRIADAFTRTLRAMDATGRPIHNGAHFYNYSPTVKIVY